MRLLGVELARLSPAYALSFGHVKCIILQLIDEGRCLIIHCLNCIAIVSLFIVGIVAKARRIKYKPKWECRFAKVGSHLGLLFI